MSCSRRAIPNAAAMRAKPTPRLPWSAHRPRTWVIRAPKNTPVMFMMPYAVALCLEDTNWQRIGILFVSNIP